MSSIAYHCAYVPAGGEIPRPRYPWQKWPDAFQTHASGVIWVVDRSGNYAKITCNAGQYHGLSITAVDWKRSDKFDLTVFWI